MREQNVKPRSRARESMAQCIFHVLVSIVVLLAAAQGAVAKPQHLEQVRTTLVARAARCASCHVSNDSEQWEGAGLNPYGQRLHDVAPDDALADRIARLDHGGRRDEPEEEKAQREKDRDVDGDGVPNWIEIIAGANPGDAKNKPPKNRIERVERVVGCNICHKENGIPGRQGLDANPHNEFGKLLAVTVDPKQDRPALESEIRRMAESLPIMKRITIVRKKKPKGSDATYWEKLRLMREPANHDDNPSGKSLKRFRKHAVRQHYKSKRDPTRGVDVEEHPLDGFLEDAKKLD